MLEDNLIYLLLILMICIIISEIIIFDFDYLEPSVIFNSLMTISCFFGVLNVNQWNLTIGEDTVLVVLLGMLAFALGDIFCRYKLFSIKNFLLDNKITVIDFSVYYIVIGSLLVGLMCMFSFYELYSLSLDLGNTSGIANMIKTVRYPMERGEITFSRWQSYRLLIAQMLAYISLYAYISNWLVNKKIKIRYLILPLLYIPFTIFTTGRIELLMLVIYLWFMSSFVYLKINCYSKKYSNKILFVAIILGAVFVFLFLLYGNFTGKVVSQSRSPFIILSHYLGLSFPALNKFLEHGLVESSTIGAETLSGIVSKLNVLGMNIEKPPVFLNFVVFNGIDTNVYSAFRRYINDYGLYGMFFVLFILGSLISYFYNYIKYKSHDTIFIILYSSYVWMLALSFHDEKFLTSGINTDIIYKIVILYIVGRLYNQLEQKIK